MADARNCGCAVYELVLSKKPATIQKAIDLATELKVPFTAKQAALALHGGRA